MSENVLERAFLQVMNESVNMALATSVNDKPNVRIVTFGFDKAQQDKLYFCTFRGNQKTKEFEQNPQVACTFLPMSLESELQVRIFGKVQKSQLTMKELIALISKKAPDGADTLKEAVHMLDVYEINFTEAWITIGMTEAQEYKL
ncbi:MAG: pyridoxamine 5'-phosphate oxidase family protein [Deferribacteraceae bacterium]|jgi:uncharacterized pyridoxamine 5'-phosphate oxidase family protein|nr:pyridoxamine 5'-phosphate oxidase family protein [Deferribacteraceae bacterium]